MRQISVGSNSVWGVSGDGRVLARIGISDESPSGREWSTVDADSMKHVMDFCFSKCYFGYNIMTDHCYNKYHL